MSFAEQLALASRKKRNHNIETKAAAIDSTSPPSSEGRANTDANNATLSFADSIKAASTPTLTSDATATTTPQLKSSARAPSPSQPSAASAASISSFADELQKRSQLGRRKVVTYSGGGNGNTVQQRTIINNDQSGDEYSAAGSSFTSSQTDTTDISTAIIDTTKKKRSSSKKKLRPITIVKSDSVGKQNVDEGRNNYLGDSLPQSLPLPNKQEQYHQSKHLPQHQINQAHNVKIADNSDRSKNNNEVFGAWAQIETLQRRVNEAEERARQESQRAEMASYELELIRDRTSTPTISNVDDGSSEYVHVGDENDDSILSSSTVSLQNSEIDLWKKRALEAEEQLLSQRRDEQVVERPPHQQHLLLPQQQQQHRLLSPPQSSTQSSVTSRGGMDEESSLELIRLKNAEIDVLRSQIHRLERRIQEESEQRQSLWHYDGSASSCGPPSVVGDDVGRDELRMLRNEIRNLQYQLSRKDTDTANNLSRKSNRGKENTTSGSTTGSTLSSLDEHENHDDEGEEEIYDEEDDDGGDGCCSSWGLCCVRRRARRRGYGRV